MKKKIEEMFVKITDVDKFYPTFVRWSKKHNFPVILRENVEEVFVCYWCGIPAYSCFVWNTRSKMCLIGFPVGDPDFEDNKNGLAFLFKEMAKTLKKRGYRKIWTTSATPPVEKALLENEFINADPNVNVYIKMM